MLGSVPASVATSRLTDLCLEESRLGGLPRCGCPCGRSARVEAGEPVSGQTVQSLRLEGHIAFPALFSEPVKERAQQILACRTSAGDRPCVTQ